MPTTICAGQVKNEIVDFMRTRQKPSNECLGVEAFARKNIDMNGGRLLRLQRKSCWDSLWIQRSYIYAFPMHKLLLIGMKSDVRNLAKNTIRKQSLEMQ